MLVWSHHIGLDKSCQLRGGLWWVMTCNLKSPWLQKALWKAPLLFVALNWRVPTFCVSV